MTWQKVTLAAVTSRPQYGAIAKGSSEPIGPRFVRQTDIASGRIDWATVPYCNLSEADFDRYALHSGDLLISRLGNGVGNAATVDESRSAVFAGYLVRFQARVKIAHPEFLGYQLQSQAWRDHVSNYRSGAAQPTLNAQQMADFEFLLPPLDEQRAIAATLGALDDKIESSARARTLLWSLLRSQWEQLASGARIGVLGEVLGLAYGKSLPATERRAGSIPVYGSSGITGTHDQALIPGPAVIVGRKGSIGEISWSHVPAYPIDTTFYVEPKAGYPLLGCYFALRSAGLQSMNSDSAVPGLNRDRALGVAVPLPDAAPASSWARDSEPLLWRIQSLEGEIERCTLLRNALLPELLSGRIRVPLEAV